MIFYTNSAADPAFKHVTCHLPPSILYLSKPPPLLKTLNFTLATQTKLHYEEILQTKTAIVYFRAYETHVFPFAFPVSTFGEGINKVPEKYLPYVVTIAPTDVGENTKLGVDCSICEEHPVDRIFGNCGHAICHRCLIVLHECPQCRGPKDAKLLFLPSAG
jgi:hypothetical protein